MKLPRSDTRLSFLVVPPPRAALLKEKETLTMSLRTPGDFFGVWQSPPWPGLYPLRELFPNPRRSPSFGFTQDKLAKNAPRDDTG